MKNRLQIVFAAGLLVLFALALADASAMAILAHDSTLLTRLVEALVLLVTVAGQYLFGSSAGSRAKDETISHLLGQPPRAQLPATASAEPAAPLAPEPKSLADRAAP